MKYCNDDDDDDGDDDDDDGYNKFVTLFVSQKSLVLIRRGPWPQSV